MKLFILILSQFVAHTLFGQNPIDTISVLSFHQKINCKEANKYWPENGIVLWQQVTFNDPNIIDDESSQILLISILDSAIKAGQRVFDLVNDSTIVKCTYDRLSPWNWSKRITKTVGQLKITSLTKKRVEAEFDLIVTEQGKGIYAYKGKRVFKKSKPLITTTYKINNRML